MAVSLTKEQTYEMFAKRAHKFTEILEGKLQPNFPLIIYTRDELVSHCTQVVKTFIEVVFSEDI